MSDEVQSFTAEPQPEPEIEPSPSKLQPVPEPEPELEAVDGSSAGDVSDSANASGVTDGSSTSGGGSGDGGSDGSTEDGDKAPKKSKKAEKGGKAKRAKKPKDETPPGVLKRTESYLAGCETVSKDLSQLVSKFGRSVGQTVGARSLLSDNVKDIVEGKESANEELGLKQGGAVQSRPGEINDTVYECLRQFTMKLDGLTANAQSHEEAIKEAGNAIAAVQKHIKTTRETLKEYGKAESALRKTLVARKNFSGKVWKEPTLWPPDQWQATRAASGKDPTKQTESERVLDVCGRRFRQSCPSTGKWTMEARELAMKQFKEQVLKMNLSTHTPEFAKSKIYLGYVQEEAGRFGAAAESFQDALDALDEQSEILQEEAFWKVQVQETELRFEAMDKLGGEQVCIYPRYYCYTAAI